MVEFLIQHGADYSLLQRGVSGQEGVDNQLQQMSNNTQSAHTAKIIGEVYPKFMTEEVKKDLEQNKDKYNQQFNDLVNNTLLSNKMTPEFQSLFIKLIENKIRDCKEKKGQGYKFVEDLLEASNSAITIEQIQEGKFNQEELIKHIKSFIVSDSDKAKEYFAKLSNKVMNLKENLKGNYYIKDKDDNIIITADQSLVIPLVLSKAEVDQHPRVIIEAIDAATMYASGGSSCLDGQLNKLSEPLIGVGEDNKELVKDELPKNEFPFKGFEINYPSLSEEIFINYWW
ncbi:MAG: hypothetical protein RCG15_03220 [Candidatus Rickettsia vulgarisii]